MRRIPSLLSTLLLAALSACGARHASPAASSAPAPPHAKHHQVRVVEPVGPPVPAPDLEVMRADPRAREMLLEDTGGAPASFVEQGAPEVAALGLQNTALGEAFGMTPITPVLVANLAKGQRASTPLTLAPGECTTVVGQGGLGVAELDLFLTIGDGGETRVLAEDPTSGPIAVLGSRERCFRNNGSAPIAGAIQARVRKGGGVVLIRVYRK